MGKRESYGAFLQVDKKYINTLLNCLNLSVSAFNYLIEEIVIFKELLVQLPAIKCNNLDFFARRFILN